MALNGKTDEELADELNKYRPNHVLQDLKLATIERDAPSEVIETLPSGHYHLEQVELSHSFDTVESLRTSKPRTDAYVNTKGSATVAHEEIRLFLAEKDRYEKLNIIYKRGLLFYGPPGEGKTSFIRNLLKETIPDDSIIISLSSVPTRTMLHALAHDEKDRLKVFIFEEFATVCSDPRQIRSVLDFLDGESSVNNSITIATTNHPELIPGNVVDRPNRFDKLIKFGHPDEEACKLLLQTFLQREPTEEEVQDCKGLSAAAIKEAAIRSISRNMELKQVFKELKEQSELVKNDFAEPKRMGLGRGRGRFDDE